MKSLLEDSELYARLVSQIHIPENMTWSAYSEQVYEYAMGR